MTVDINKIRDNQLTEDEKMGIIADYLENGGGGGGGDGGDSSQVREPVLLHIHSLNRLIAEPGDEIYTDSAMQHPLTKAEMCELILNVYEDYQETGEMNPPREAWLFVHDSSDAVYKVLGGYYDDMGAGFIIAGLSYDDKLDFYRIYTPVADSSTTSFNAIKLTTLQ